MEVEFMTADTALPPCMPLPRAMLRLPISSTAKVMYARMLDIVFLSGIEDANGILFIHFPIVELAVALARSTMTVKRSLNELEDAGLILRVRQGLSLIHICKPVYGYFMDEDENFIIDGEAAPVVRQIYSLCQMCIRDRPKVLPPLTIIKSNY